MPENTNTESKEINIQKIDISLFNELSKYLKFKIIHENSKIIAQADEKNPDFFEIIGNFDGPPGLIGFDEDTCEPIISLKTKEIIPLIMQSNLKPVSFILGPAVLFGFRKFADNFQGPIYLVSNRN